MQHLSQNQVLILGSGTSTGVPMSVCECAVCTSTNPKNKRLRTSIFLKTKKGKQVLIDTTPDFRYQSLKYKIKHIDFVIITHDHADHIHGIDDLRPFCFLSSKKVIPIYTTQKCANNLKERFPYIFQKDKLYSTDRPVLGGGIPSLELKIIDDFSKPTIIENEIFEFFEFPHGYGTTLGLIHETLGFVTDIHEFNPKQLKKFKNKKLDIMILDCIRKGTHDTHLTLERALPYLETINAKFSGLIHIAHQLDHEELTQELIEKYGNENILPLYDGQTLSYKSF
ncbi:MAG: MBL fold metallo-hydrolase [Bacteriovoracaceae bacterium]